MKISLIKTSLVVVVLHSGLNASAQITVDSSGKVGIGTSAPWAKLSIESSVPHAGGRPVGGINFSSPNNANVSGQIGLVQNTSEGNHYLLIQSVEDTVAWRPVVFARDGGNVGIGTTTPSDLLEVSSAGDAQITITADTNNSGENDNPTLFLQQDGGATGGLLGVNGSDGVRFSGAIANATFLESKKNDIQFVTGGQTMGGSDGAARLTILETGEVGIGTNTPGDLLEVSSEGDAQITITADSGNNDETKTAALFLQQDGGLVGVTFGINGETDQRFYDAIENAAFIDTLGSTAGKAFQIATGGYSTGSIESTARVTVMPNGNVGIGTTSPVQKLQVSGTVRATSFISDTTTYADFVFDSDYSLPALSEVEEHIEVHGHLPGIPSEAEVMADGIDLAAMQVALLQKIEELTLHQIAQDKRIRALEAENAQLR